MAGNTVFRNVSELMPWLSPTRIRGTLVTVTKMIPVTVILVIFALL